MTYGIVAVVLGIEILWVLALVAEFIKAITRWVNHDLKMRRGNCE